MKTGQTKNVTKIAARKLRSDAKLRLAVTERLEDRQLMADVGGGLVANYYSDANLKNLALARTDATVDFNWGTAAPAAGVPAEGFSVRWTGQLLAPVGGNYTLTAESAGGIRVTVGGTTVIDDWATHAKRSKSGTVDLTGGSYSDITIEYRDAGAAAAKLLWTVPGKSAAVIPQANLFRLGTGWVSDGWVSESLSAGGVSTRSATAGGSFSSTGDTFTVSAGGTGRGLATRTIADGTQLAYKTLRGDGEIVAKLESVAGGTADVVFRDSLDAGSPYVDLTVGGGKAWIEYRTNAGDAVKTTTSTPVSGAVFLKLSRDGNSFAGYVSKTGAEGSWTLVGTAASFQDVFAEVGIAADAGTTRSATGATATYTSVRVASTPALGGNLQRPYSSDSERPFNDMMKLLMGWQTFTGKPAPLGADKWPSGDDYQAVVAGNGNIPSGRYTIVFTGPAGAEVQSMRSGTKVSKGSYDPATRTHVWYAQQAAGQSSLGFRWHNARGAKNFRVLQPGAPISNTPTYAKKYLDYLKFLKPASLRFMDYTITNDSTNSKWSQRSTMTSTDWTPNGVAWEACIELCNEIGANPYISVPGRADNDYVRRLAELIEAKLRPDLNVYVENGNEMWSMPFANSPWNSQEAADEVRAMKRAGKQSNLNYDNQKVPSTGTNRSWSLRRIARRGKEIADIFRDVYQDNGRGNPINSKVRVMMAAQVANLTTYKVMGDFISKNYGKPSNWFYAMAAAPYFTMQPYTDRRTAGGWTTLTQHATKAQILSAMNESSGAYIRGKKFTQFLNAGGKPYGLKLVLYEGGHSTYGPFNIAAKAAATLDPKMKSMMKGYLSAFFAEGGAALHYYTLGAKEYDTMHGTWPITPDPENLNTPKIQAFKEVRSGIGLRDADPSAGVYG